MSSLLRIGLFLLILLTGLAAIGIYWTFYKPLPNYSGTLELAELQSPVDVHWDSYGVPYIHAQSENDLYFAAGYVHAQERIWQMTLSQLSAEGRFAEFLGEELLELDKFQRTLGFWETARRIEEESSAEVLSILQRYADGVNRYVEDNRKNLPIEFSLTDIKPIEWTPTHTIALTRLMAWDQNMHWWSELSIAYLADIIEPQRLQELIPAYNDRYPTLLNDSESRGFASSALPLLETDLKRRSILSLEGTQFGSNAWALRGEKTESGSPILAGDPHMGLSIPGFWFEVHYSLPGHRVTGATIPGLPIVILGKNDNVAWTITNMMADVTDFFVETPSPENPNRYITDSTSAPATTEAFEFRDEIIQVKGGDDRLFRVRSTVNGPVISDFLNHETFPDDKVISLSWTGNRVSHETLAGYRMNRARNMEEFEEAISGFRSPAMNFTYADRFNNIAIFSAASIPVRSGQPLLFRDGSNPASAWQGTLRQDQLPRVVNPDNNFVAHANNKIHTDSYPHYIGSFWAPPSRIMRITQMLEQSENVTTDDVRTLQFDHFSEHAREITEMILPMLRSDSPYDFSTVLPYLENWDYLYNPSSTAATIFDLFFLNLSRNVLATEIGEEAYQSLASLSYVPVQIISRMLDQNSPYFNRTDSPLNDDRAMVVQEAMHETVEQLGEMFGDEPINWRWENVNTITLRPPLLGEAAAAPEAPAVLRTIVNNLFSRGPYPVHGHALSVNKAEYGWDRPFEVTLGPSIRRIVDFSSPGRALSILPTGQSGNPISTHYGDQTDMWLDGRYRFIYQDSTFFQQASYRTMRMLPSD